MGCNGRVHKKKRSRTGLPNMYSHNVGCMYRLLKDRNVPKKAKQIIHQTILIPILIFGSECWSLDKRTRTEDYNSRHESYHNDTRGHQMGQKEK